MGVTHAFVNAHADGGDGTLSKPSDWNAPHVIAAATITLAMNVNVSASQRAIGRNTAGAGVQEEVTASQLFDWVSNTNGVLLTRSAGTWGAVANASIDNGDIVLANNATPSAPSAGVKVFGSSHAGRQMPAFLAPVGGKSLIQSFLGSRHRIEIIPSAAFATMQQVGHTWTTMGTATARTPANTSLAAGTRRIGFVSAVGANSITGLRAGASHIWRGNVALGGGFHVVWRFMVSDAVLVGTANMFVGVQPANVPTDVDPATLINLIGVGCTNADTVMQLYAADGTARTKTSLGALFPVNTVTTDVYEFALYCPPNGADVRYQLTRLNTTDTVGGIISAAANMPLSNVLLAAQAWRSNGGTATAVGIDVGSMYLDSEI